MKKVYKSVIERYLFAPAYGALALSAALLAAPAAQAQVISSTPKIEAESAVLTGGAAVATTIQPFSGTGYVDYNGSPSSVTFSYTAAAAGYHDIVIRYESQFGFKFGDILVNGGPRSEVYFNTTQQGVAGQTNPTFRSTTPRRILLNAGVNTIEIARGYNYYGIDYIQIAPSSTTLSLTPAATTGRVEAEAGQLFATQAFARDGDTTPRSGANGGLYVGNFNGVPAVGSFIKLPVNIATAGLYQIAVGARNEGTESNKQFELAVTTATSNGGPLTTVLGPNNPNFSPFVAGKYNLTAGINTITITSQTAFIDVDYVDITATTGTATATLAGADAQRALTVYPNPSNGQTLTVGLTQTTARTASIDLVNALGQRVLTATRSLAAGDNTFALPTTGVAPGLYQLVVRSANQPTLSHRVVVN